MRWLKPTNDPYDVMGMYGPGPLRQGVLNEHLHLVPPGAVRDLTRTQWVVTADGIAWPVLCGAVIPIVTEDGPSDGHCGATAVKGRGACEGHADERDDWLAMSEAEKAHWERRHDEEARFG